MSSLKMWALSICSAAIALAALEGLLPEKSAARAAKLAAGLWFIVALITPLKGIELNESDLPIMPDDFFVEEYAQYSDDLVADETERILINELFSRLAREGVKPSGVDVAINIAPEGGIYCDSVSITLARAEADKADLVSAAVREVTGVKPEIRWDTQ